MHLLRAIILFSCFSQTVIAADIWETLFKDNQSRAEQGDLDAQYETGIMFLKGQGTGADRVMGMDWLEKAADQGHEKAKRKLAREKKNNDKFNTLVKKAENGDANAQYEVAMMLNSGRGVNLDHEQALNWFTVAADQGHKKSVTQKAIMLFKGEGVRKNAKEAVNLFLSISDSEVIAQYYLGEAYAAGDGVSRDLDIAWGWYRKAADGGFGRAEGKAINVEEEINMERQRASRAKEKRAKRIESPVVVVEPAPVVATEPVVKPKNVVKPKTVRKSAPVKKPKLKAKPKPKKKIVKKKPVKTAPKVAKKVTAPATRPTKAKTSPEPVIRIVEIGTNKGFGLDHLLSRKWSSKGKSMTFLPSLLNKCAKEGKKVTCWSHEIDDHRAGSMIKYKVKSIISKVNGSEDSFTATYKNLVLDVVQLDSAEEAEEAEEAGISQGFKVRTGWTRKKVAKCTFISSDNIHCIKDGVYKIDVRARNY